MKPLVIIGGYLTSPHDFAALVPVLAKPPYSYQAFIAPISSLRWAITRDWDFRPVIDIVRATVEQALSATGAQHVDIVAHSVGGIVARMYLGDKAYRGKIYAGRRYVKRLVTLGTPHHSQEFWTRQSIGFVNNTYPGAFYHDIHYVSVIGRALQGKRRGRFVERMAHQSYSTVSGPAQAETWGDGITTLPCAALRGAEYLVINGLTHSSFHGRPWYGDVEGLKQWGRALGKGHHHAQSENG